MILGLDISTSIVGATILGNEGEVVYCEASDLRNKKYSNIDSNKVTLRIC